MTSNNNSSMPALTVGDRLNLAQAQCGMLKLAAATCAVNFGWLAFGEDGLYIPLLDFDVICGALPSVVLQEAVDSEKMDLSCDPLCQLIGPNVADLVLRSVREFSLPPGTAGELVCRRTSTHRGVSAKGSSFLEKLRAAQQASDPFKEIVSRLGPVGEVQDVIRDAVSDITFLISDLDLLDRVVSAAKPFEDLVTRDYDKNSSRALIAVYSYLQGVRQNKDMQNFSDALNVACSVWAFNKPGPTGSHRRLPVLISQTAPVTKYREESSRWLHNEVNDLWPTVIADAHYLIISENLMRKAKCYGFGASHARALEQDIDKLDDVYRSLRKWYAQRIRSGVPASDISVDELPQHLLDYLWIQRQSLQDSWGEVLFPVAKATEFDRIEYVNRIISPSVCELIRKSNPNALRELEHNLRRSASPYLDIRDPLELVVATEHSDRMQQITARFGFYRAGNTTGFFGDAALEQSEIQDTDEIDTCGSHCVRLVVAPRYFRQAAMLAVDSRRQEDYGPRIIGVVWPCAREIDVLMHESIEMLSQMIIVGDCGGEMHCVFYDNERKYLASSEDLISSSLIPNVLGMMPEANHCVIKAGRLVISLDFRPIDYNEMQAWLTVYEDDWRPQYARIVANTVANTAMVSLGAKHYSRFLEHMLRHIGIQHAEGQG